jgi:hypothetical protein
MPTARTTKVLGIDGTRLTLDGQPFHLQGLSFFNAVFNTAFNRSPSDRLHWLGVFQANGINCLRVWCQWDFVAPNILVDVDPESSMYTVLGEIRDEPFATLQAIVEAMDSLGMVVEVCMFAQEKRPYLLSVASTVRATEELTARLRPYGNVIQQVWNEYDAEVLRYIAAIKAVDPDRIATSSPGATVDHRAVFDHVGDEAQNTAFDVLTPHTLRREAFPFWYVAPAQIEYLLDAYRKPVIDDEPARNGPMQFGGVPGGTRPEQHIEQIRRVRAVGGYHIYHHDMFQWPDERDFTPPTGIPDPDFSPFHRQVFDYLRDHQQW